MCSNGSREEYASILSNMSYEALRRATIEGIKMNKHGADHNCFVAMLDLYEKEYIRRNRKDIYERIIKDCAE